MGNLTNICWRDNDIEKQHHMVDYPKTMNHATSWSSGTPTSSFNTIYPKSHRDPLHEVLVFVRDENESISFDTRYRVNINDGQRLGFKPFKIT